MIPPLAATLEGMSLRSSERGLKSAYVVPNPNAYAVAPFVGAWIEICTVKVKSVLGSVAPFVGAWIEICHSVLCDSFLSSLRSSERGLKSTKASNETVEKESLRSSERGLKFK